MCVYDEKPQMSRVGDRMNGAQPRWKTWGGVKIVGSFHADHGTFPKQMARKQVRAVGMVQRPSHPREGRHKKKEQGIQTDISPKKMIRCPTNTRKRTKRHHEGNENQNHSKIPLLTATTEKTDNRKCW